jgi:hypothetical protein
MQCGYQGIDCCGHSLGRRPREFTAHRGPQSAEQMILADSTRHRGHHVFYTQHTHNSLLELSELVQGPFVTITIDHQASHQNNTLLICFCQSCHGILTITEQCSHLSFTPHKSCLTPSFMLQYDSYFCTVPMRPTWGARSSVGQSASLIMTRSQVRALPSPPSGPHCALEARTGL